MSTGVDLDRLRGEISGRSRAAFVVTAAADGPPHTVAEYLRWRGGALEVPCGDTTARNLASRPAATVLVPADEIDGYTLIVEVEGEVFEGDERTARLTPTHVVLHRPAAAAGPGTHRHDCAPL